MNDPPVSETALEFVARFEGLRANALRLADGRWVIGYNHIVEAAPHTPVNAVQARAWLVEDLAECRQWLEDAVFAPLAAHERDALLSFAFSVGREAFLESDVLKRLNGGDPLGAAAAMQLYCFSAIDGGAAPLDALVRRRAAEAALFLTGGPVAAAPSARLAPCTAPGPPHRGVLDAKLSAILASEEHTKRALSPPPPLIEPLEAPSPLEVLSPQKESPPRDALIGFVAVGLALCALGGLGLALSGGAGQAMFLVFTPPGLLALGLAAYQYFAKAPLTGP